jgi:hypothetical protein
MSISPVWPSCYGCTGSTLPRCLEPSVPLTRVSSRDRSFPWPLSQVLYHHLSLCMTYNHLLWSIAPGYKMLKRTAPLSEFSMEPLHVPSSFGSSSSSSISLVTAPTRQQRPSIPVYILISGHAEKGLDPRLVWGADGVLSDLGFTPATASSVSNSSGNVSEEMLSLTSAKQSESSAQGACHDTDDEEWECITFTDNGWWREIVAEGSGERDTPIQSYGCMYGNAMAA